MKMEMNEIAFEQRVNIAVNHNIELIDKKLNDGYSVIELLIDKDISSSVKERLEHELKDTEFDWCVVEKRANPFTGKIENFRGVLVGDKMFYKIKFFPQI